MRQPLIAGNWKMNTTIQEALNLVKAMQASINDVWGIEKAVFPPFISLFEVAKVLKGSQIKLGAQNMYWEEKGAFTGEVSPLMLSGICEYVILGHSERRQYFHETDELINKKIKSALAHNLKPILCVGESLEQHDAGKTEAVVLGQVKECLDGVLNANGLVIAYEPVWAIGTGKAATGAQAGRVIGQIRDTLAKQFSDKFADSTRILYGGSVTPTNSDEFMKESQIDGALVGGASIKTDQFSSIVRQTAMLKR